MIGDGPTRFCPQCSKDVHNLSGMQIDWQRQELSRIVGERARTRDPAARLTQEAQIRDVQQRLTELRERQQEERETQRQREDPRR